MTNQMSIDEAATQLQECADEVSRIRSKISELKQSDSPLASAQRERDMAQALMAGGDVAEIVAVPLTSAQLRKAVLVLEAALAEALDRESQAKAALRAAKIRRARELLQERRTNFEAMSKDLIREWAEVTALAQEVAQMVGGVNQLPSSWFSLAIPIGVEKRVNPFFDSGLHPSGTEIMSSLVGNAARAAIAIELKKEKIQ